MTVQEKENLEKIKMIKMEIQENRMSQNFSSLSFLVHTTSRVRR